MTIFLMTSFVKAQTRRRPDSTPKIRYQNPAQPPVFLRLGPWYYDNGSVEVTRADERHDRVDVPSRVASSASR